MNPKNNEPGQLINAAEVRFVRILPGTVESVWEYVVDPAKRRLWFAGGTTSLEVGGKMTLEFRNKELAGTSEVVPEKYQGQSVEGLQFEVTVTRCEAPRVFGFTWDGPEVIIELAPHGDEVQLTLTHRNLPNHKEVVDVSGGWHIHLTVLVAKLEGSVQPPFWSTLERVEKEYETRFGAAE